MGTKSSKFLQACTYGDLDLVERAVAEASSGKIACPVEVHSGIMCQPNLGPKPTNSEMFTINKRFRPTLKELLEYEDSAGWRPLHYASVMGHLEIVKILIEAKADPNFQDKAGETAMHLAAFAGRTEIVCRLAWAGGDINQRARRERGGWTPLHVAAFKGRRGAVKALLREGAHRLVGSSCDHRGCRAGSSPANVASAAGHQQLALLISSWGTKMQLPSGGKHQQYVRERTIVLEEDAAEGEEGLEAEMARGWRMSRGGQRAGPGLDAADQGAAALAALEEAQAALAEEEQRAEERRGGGDDEEGGDELEAAPTPGARHDAGGEGFGCLTAAAAAKEEEGGGEGGKASLTPSALLPKVRKLARERPTARLHQRTASMEGGVLSQ